MFEPISGGMCGQMPPLLLYSTNTSLALRIARQYYGDKHFMYCAPEFDPRDNPSLMQVTPPTSCPKLIYRSLAEEVVSGERHSAKIEQNRAGIIKGAIEMQGRGNISKKKVEEIKYIVQVAQNLDFKPYLCIMAYPLAKKYSTDVPVAKKANPLSEEYIVSDIPARYFDALDLGVLK